MGEDMHVYLNQGVLRVVLVVESREQNEELLGSLFGHLGEWFDANAQHLADTPELDGGSWRLHEDLFQIPSSTADMPQPGDTFPEGWLS